MVVKEKKTGAHDHPQDKKSTLTPSRGQAGTGKPVKDKTIKIKDSEYQSLKQTAAEFKDKYIRVLAEFENVRKRTDREKIEFVKYANEGLVTEFLGILDDLKRAVDVAHTKHDDYEAFLKGVKMVMARIDEMLKKNDVKPVEAVGKIFDPHCHEILMQMETKEHDDGMVVEEFQKGYSLGEKIIRTAKVKVAVNKKEEEQEEEKEKIEEIE